MPTDALTTATKLAAIVALLKDEHGYWREDVSGADFVQEVSIIIDEPTAPEPPMQVLLLHSEDGQDWTHAILFPPDWTPEHATARAVEAFAAAQHAKRIETECEHEWNWGDYEPELKARGFVIPAWHHGPMWDATL